MAWVTWKTVCNLKVNMGLGSNTLAYSIGNFLQNGYGGLLRRDMQSGMGFWFIDMGTLLEDFYPKMCQEQSVKNQLVEGPF